MDQEFLERLLTAMCVSVGTIRIDDEVFEQSKGQCLQWYRDESNKQIVLTIRSRHET